MKGVSGTKLNDIYMTAWKTGMKTTYYLRTLGATQIEKSTLDAKKYGYTQKREYKSSQESVVQTVAVEVSSIEVVQQVPEVKLCKLTDPDCESCQ
jgi:ribonucleoside-diphosphate reductase alpha chain